MLLKEKTTFGLGKVGDGTVAPKVESSGDASVESYVAASVVPDAKVVPSVAEKVVPKVDPAFGASKVESYGAAPAKVTSY